MALKIGFISSSLRFTRLFFDDFINVNCEQIRFIDRYRNYVILTDGSVVKYVPPNLWRLAGLDLDQVILAGPYVLQMPTAIIQAISQTMRKSCVPDDFKWQYYDPDATEIGGVKLETV